MQKSTEILKHSIILHLQGIVPSIHTHYDRCFHLVYEYTTCSSCIHIMHAPKHKTTAPAQRKGLVAASLRLSRPTLLFAVNVRFRARVRRLEAEPELLVDLPHMPWALLIRRSVHGPGGSGSGLRRRGGLVELAEPVVAETGGTGRAPSGAPTGAGQRPRGSDCRAEADPRCSDCRAEANPRDSDCGAEANPRDSDCRAEALQLLPQRAASQARFAPTFVKREVGYEKILEF